jgi:hypothetical protein
MHDHLKLVHPELPRSYAQEEVRFVSQGLGLTMNAGLKRRYQEDDDAEDEEMEAFRTRPDNAAVNKRIFRRLLAQFILSANVAERIVENTHFRKLLVYLEPTIQEDLIGRNTMGREIVRLWYSKREDLKFQLGRHIASGGMISLTLDGWTSISQQGYLAITAHYAQRLGSRPTELKETLLAFEPVLGSHNASNLSAVILSTLEAFGINERIRAITSDSASVNTATFQALEDSGRMGNFTVKNCTVRCMAHAMNLSAQKILSVLDKDTDPINEEALARDRTIEHTPNTPPANDFDPTEECDAAVAKIFRIARKIIAKIRKSNLLTEALEDILKKKCMPVLKLILDVRTRWNSTHFMVQRLLKLRPAIDILCVREPALYRLNLLLDDFDWKWLGILDEVLEVYARPTTLVSGDTYPTLAYQLPQYWQLALKLREFGKRFEQGEPEENETLEEACSIGWSKLNQYHLKTDGVTAPRIATALDPRFKLRTLELLGWKTGDIKKAKTGALKPLLRQYFPPKKRSTAENPEDSEPEDEPTTDNLSPEDAMIFASQEEYSQAETQALAGSTAAVWEAELERYLKNPRVSKDTDVLLWWDDNEHRYPHLAKLARDYLAIPASSVPAERVFSRAGDLISKKRNRLSRETANMLMCLRYWLKLPEATAEEKGEYVDRQENPSGPPDVPGQDPDESPLLHYIRENGAPPDDELEL